MKPSLEPTSNGVIIEVPETSDTENPYLETPDMSDLMPVIFPGGGGGASGGGALGDWYASPVSGDGMLSEIATFCGYVSDWTWGRVDGVMVVKRERFLGNYTISRTGGGAWEEVADAARGFGEPLKRLTIAGIEGESGYYLERYVFDGQHIPRNDTLSSVYPEYDYDAPVTACDAGQYGLQLWLFDRAHGYSHMVDDNWIEYKCPSYAVCVPDQTYGVEVHRNIIAYCVSDDMWHIFGQRNYTFYAEYDRYIDDVFVERVSGGVIDYSYYLRDWPSGVLSKEIQRQHYPRVGTEAVSLSYKPSILPVILGGALPSYLILIAIILCAVSNGGVVSSVDDDIDSDEQVRRYI